MLLLFSCIEMVIIRATKGCQHHDSRLHIGEYSDGRGGIFFLFWAYRKNEFVRKDGEIPCLQL